MNMEKQDQAPAPATATALQIVIVYAVFASLWILFSDRAIGQLSANPETITLLGTCKGWLFVAVTSVLLYTLIQRLSNQFRAALARERAAQEESTRTRQLLTAIINSSGDAIFAKDLQGRYFLSNNETAQLLGKEAERVLQEDDCALFPPLAAETIQARDRKIIADNQTLTYEETLPTANGERLFVSTKGPLRDSDGQVIGVFGISRDITEQRRTEASLSYSVSLANAALESTADAILIVDRNGKIARWNQKFIELWKVPEDLLGDRPDAPLLEYVTARMADPDAFLARVAQFYEHPDATGSDTLRLADGRTIERYSHPHRVGDEIIGRLWSFRDVTERKRITDAITESKTLLQRVIDATPDWIYVKDRQHRFMLVNEPFARVFELTPAAMIGRCDTDFSQLDVRVDGQESTIKRLHDDDDAVFAGRSLHYPSEKFYFGNGEIRVLDSFKRPIRDAEQNIYGILCYRRDITEHFKAAQEQKILETQLQQAQKMEIIGHLTGGIAHDFNNILSAVLGYAELIQLSPQIEQDPELSDYLREILQAGIRAKELVAQLLSFSHRREAASEAIDVAPIVKEVVRLLRSTMPTSISIDCEIDDSLPEVLISPVQLHQIVMNLGVNARDAMAGSGSLEIRAKQVLVDETNICTSCRQGFSGNYLVISVRDSGAGISPENLTKIFDPFFTTKNVGQGTGLGLSVLHGIVHSAKGHVEVLSTPGDGTEFRIYLPPHVGAVERIPRDTHAGAKASTVRGHVLVVDDEVSIVRFMTVLLENLGCRVTGTTSATEALRLFQDDPSGVDLVITDQTMPDLAGVELARALLRCRPDIPIVLSTGYSNAIDEESARMLGIRRFVLKPVPAKLLADIVTECLAEKS